MDGANRHRQPRRLHGWSLRGTCMVERDRWEARLAIRSMPAPPGMRQHAPTDVYERRGDRAHGVLAYRRA